MYFFYFCNQLAEEERAGCFTLIVFLLSWGCCGVWSLFCYVGALCLFLTEPWVGMQGAIVLFLVYTQLLSETNVVYLP